MMIIAPNASFVFYFPNNIPISQVAGIVIKHNQSLSSSKPAPFLLPFDLILPMGVCLFSFHKPTFFLEEANKPVLLFPGGFALWNFSRYNGPYVVVYNSRLLPLFVCSLICCLPPTHHSPRCQTHPGWPMSVIQTNTMYRLCEILDCCQPPIPAGFWFEVVFVYWELHDVWWKMGHIRLVFLHDCCSKTSFLFLFLEKLEKFAIRIFILSLCVEAFRSKRFNYSHVCYGLIFSPRLWCDFLFGSLTLESVFPLCSPSLLPRVPPPVSRKPSMFWQGFRSYSRSRQIKLLTLKNHAKKFSKNTNQIFFFESNIFSTQQVCGIFFDEWFMWSRREHGQVQENLKGMDAAFRFKMFSSSSVLPSPP